MNDTFKVAVLKNFFILILCAFLVHFGWNEFLVNVLPDVLHPIDSRAAVGLSCLLSALRFTLAGLSNVAVNLSVSYPTPKDPARSEE